MHDIFCDIDRPVPTREKLSERKGARQRKRKPKKRKPTQCLVRGNKVFFYGKTARLIQKALDVTGETPEQFLTRALDNQVAYLKAQGKLK